MIETKSQFLAIGECMIEFAHAPNGRGWQRNFAGDTFNTAWYFHRHAPAGWSTAYFTAVGDDAASDQLVAFIEGTGVSARWIARIAGRSPGLYMIDLDGVERHFSYWREASAARQLADDRERLEAALGESALIYLSGITLAILREEARQRLMAGLKTARAAGKTIAFDPNIRPRLWVDAEAGRTAITDAARVSHIVLPTFSDEAGYFGDASPGETGERYRAAGADIVIVKNGTEPCLALAARTTLAVPAVPVTDPVDTTGAGDSFNGAFLAARAGGADLKTALEIAHATAANTVRGYGALVA